MGSKCEGYIPRLKENITLCDNIKYVADLCDESGLWRVQDIRTWFDDKLADTIVNISRSSLEEDDEIVWAPKLKGQFSVKSSYAKDQSRRMNLVSALDAMNGGIFGR